MFSLNTTSVMPLATMKQRGKWITQQMDQTFSFPTDVEYQGGGVLPSEMSAFAAMCVCAGVTVVIESGRRKGYSTECLGKMPVSAFSIEISPRSDEDDRIAKKCHVSLLNGNAISMLPALVAKHPNERIALLLDGPKGPKALELFDRVKSKIVFAAFHDISKKIEHPGELVDNPSRPIFEKRDAWFTDEPEYLTAWAHLDKHAWSHFDKYKSRADMTYAGFTLAFLQGDKFR